MRVGLGLGVSFNALLYGGALTSGGGGGGGGSTTATVNNTGGAAQTDYQVLIPLTYRSGMKLDFSDVRVADGVTTLSHFIDPASLVLGTSCHVWVKIPTLGVESRALTVSWDGSRASASDPENVFSFYDDFATFDAAAWTYTSQFNGDKTHGLKAFSYEQIIKGDMEASAGPIPTPDLIGAIQGDKANNRLWVFYKKNPDDGDGNFKVFDYAGADISMAVMGVASRPCPEHPASTDVRLDNGNFIVGGAGAPHLDEISPTTGALVKRYNYTGANTAGWALITYYGPGQVLLCDTATANVLTVRLCNLNFGAGTVTYAGTEWTMSTASFDNMRIQGLIFKDGKLYLCGDSKAMAALHQFGVIAEITIPPGGGAITTDRLFRYIGRDGACIETPNTLTNFNATTGGAERQGLSWDGSAFVFADASGFVYRGVITDYNVMQLGCHGDATTTANASRLQSVATHGLNTKVVARAKGEGYVGMGYAATLAITSPMRSTSQSKTLVVDDVLTSMSTGFKTQRTTTVNADQLIGYSKIQRKLNLWQISRTTNFTRAVCNFGGAGEINEQSGLVSTTSAIPVTLYAEGTNVSGRTWAELEVAWLGVAKSQDVEPTISVS